MIVASNNFTLSNVNDGSTPYIHIAYANSADGTDGFYVSGGRTNLLTNTGDLNANWGGYTSISTTTKYNGHPSMVFNSSTTQLAFQRLSLGTLQNSTQYTASFWAKADNAGDKAHTELWGGNGNTIFSLTTDWVYYTTVVTSYSDANTNNLHSICYFGVPSGNKGNVYIAEPKLELGTTATPWCPAPSESNPTYMGTYTDYTQSVSLDPTAYHWSLIKGADGKDGAPGIPGAPGKDGQTTYFHIAYANSADGSVGFTDTPGNNSYDYFGTYTDYTLSGSKDPTKYKWVKMFDSSKKRNFTTTPTTPYSVGDTWTQSGATYFCTTERLTGAFNASDWQMQQLTIQSLDSDLQANINGTKNLLMVDDIIYYSSPALDSTNTYNEGYQFDYTSTDTTYVFQVQAKSTVNGDYVNMYPALGSAYSQSENKTSQVKVTTSPSVSNQTSTFTSSDSNVKLALTTDWVTYTCVISGTWDKGAVLTALLGRVYNSETKGTVAFRNIKLVAGTAITDYTSDDSITVAQGSNYWDLTTLQQNSNGLNLLTGTSSGLQTKQFTNSYNSGPQATNGNYQIKLFKGQTYKYRAWLDNTNGPVNAFVNVRFTPIGGTNSNLGSGTPIVPGATGYSTLSIKPPADGYALFVPFAYGSPQTFLAKWKEEKLEVGSVATAWSPNPSDSNYDTWLQNRYYTPWYPISEGQRVFLTHYDYPAYPGTPTSASVEFADSNHNFISNGTNNSQGSSTLDGINSSFISPQSLSGVYYNERMLNISIVSEAFTSGTYQDLYIETSGLLQSKLAVSGRGTTVATFDPYSGQRVDTQYWDTYAMVDNVNALVNYLNSIANQDLVVAIATQDSFIQDSNDFQTASQNLCTVLQSMGLPSSYTPSDLRGRVSFAFVGHTTAYQGTNDKALVSSSKGDNQVSTLTAYVSNGHISSANNTGIVNGMNIGGRNLLIGTSENETSGKAYNFAGYQISGGLQPNTTYTLSGWARVDQTSLDHQQHVFIDAYAKGWSWWTQLNINSSLSYQYNKLTFTTPSRGTFNPFINVYLSHPDGGTNANANDAISGTAFIKKLKLEVGSVATPWSPNPSDSNYASWLQTQHQGALVAYANAPANTAYFRAGYSFSTDEINRVRFMVTVDKLSTNYSSSIADVSSNAVRKDVSYKGVTLNDNGLTATAGDTQVAVNSTDGFEIKKKGTNVFSVDTNGNLTITGSTISTGNISGVDFQGKDLTLSGTLNVQGSIVAENNTFTIDQNGMTVSPTNGGSVTISSGGLTIQGETAGSSQSTAAIYGNNDSLSGDAGLFATKDKTGNTKTWITSSGTLVAQDAVIHGNVSVDNLTLTSPSSKIMFGSGFEINGNGEMTVTSNSNIYNGTYSSGTIEGSELDIGTAYHSKLSNEDKYRYHVSNIGETTFGMSQDLGLMSSTQGLNESYLSLNNAWTQGQINFNNSGQAPNNAIRSLGLTQDIYTDSYGWKHRFSAPVYGPSDIYNTISIWNKSLSGTIPSYNIGYSILDSITNTLNKQMVSWGGGDTPNWTLGTIEFPRLGASLFAFSDPLDLYPAQNQTIALTAGVTYVFGAYIWHCGLNGGARLTIELSTSDSAAQNSSWAQGNIVDYYQSGYSICTYTPSSNVYLRRVYIEAGTRGSKQGCDYGVPLSITDPFAVPLNQFTSKLFGGGLDTLTSLGGRFGMPYPHLDSSQHGVLGLMRADNLTAGDKIVVSVPINYESGTMANFPQINLGLAKPGNDDIYIPLDGEFQPLMSGYYTYDFYFVWQDEYKNYINNNLVQLNLISNGIGSGEKAYVVSVDSVRMGIYVGTATTSSTKYVNEYQARFSPLGSLQLSHISNVGANGYTIAGQTQLTSEGLEINSSFSTSGSDSGGMHISINGKSGISIGGNMNFGNAQTQPALSFYGYAPYDTLLENAIEPQYNVGWDAYHSASGIWFDSYGNVHGYDSSAYWNMESPSGKSHLGVPLQDGYSFSFALSSPDNYTLPGSRQYANNQVGADNLKLGLVHFYNVNGGYLGGYYPAFYTGSGNSLAGIAFGSGYVIIFGNRNKTNNLWSFPQGTSDGHTSNSGSIEEVTPNHPF